MNAVTLPGRSCCGEQQEAGTELGIALGERHLEQQARRKEESKPQGKDAGTERQEGGSAPSRAPGWGRWRPVVLW